MDTRTPELRAELSLRLRRIEGQVRGVQRMIEEGRDCPDVLQQMTAIRSAVHQAGLILARAYIAECMQGGNQGQAEVALDRLMITLEQLD